MPAQNIRLKQSNIIRISCFKHNTTQHIITKTNLYDNILIWSLNIVQTTTEINKKQSGYVVNVNRNRNVLKQKKNVMKINWLQYEARAEINQRKSGAKLNVGQKIIIVIMIKCVVG